MQFSSDDIRDYPNVHWFISKALPETRTQYDKVYKAYVNTCANGCELVGISRSTLETTAAAALVWAHKPLVVSAESFTDKGTLAVTYPATMQIHVRKDLFGKVEEAARSGKKSERQHYFRQLQALLLHECIHWVRFLPFTSTKSRKKVKLFMNVDLPVDTKHGGRSVDGPGGKPQTKLTQYELGFASITAKGSQTRGLSEAGDAFENAAYGNDLSSFWQKQSGCGTCH